ncbi:MAG: DNA/RNA non-specific endonuclease [Bacteroidales bacterium]|nr:DNA/RNA non-specific endonuclease [Bacteroidales bacterium]
MKSKRLLRTIAAAILLSAVFSCGKNEAAPEAPVFSVKMKESSVLSAQKGSAWVSVVADGTWTLALKFEEGVAPWASLNMTVGTGNAENVMLKYDANPDQTGRALSLVLSSGTKESESVVRQRGLGEGDFGQDVARMDWLELPATKAGDGREVLVHNYQGGVYRNRNTDGVRNWTCYWDSKEHMSLWVAYPLNPNLKGSGSRIDGWGAIDPCLPADKQPFLGGGSYGGGMTRGHQLPAADRASSHAAAHRSTYYSTNQTPQDYDFNSGIWLALENQVRGFAQKADTLYVVTGALFSGSTRWTWGNSGFEVKIPTHYFKALLYRGSAAGTINGFMAAGWFFDHNPNLPASSVNSYIMSIDQLEQKTQIDFFPNLAKQIGQTNADKVEAAEPATFWK